MTKIHDMRGQSFWALLVTSCSLLRRLPGWPRGGGGRVGAGGGARQEGAMGSGSPADLVLTGGHVYLVDAARSWAGAVAVAGGRIVAVGTDAQVSAHIGPRTEVIGLAGRMVLPGFIDSHIHASAGGLERI